MTTMSNLEKVLEILKEVSYGPRGWVIEMVINLAALTECSFAKQLNDICSASPDGAIIVRLAECVRNSQPVDAYDLEFIDSLPSINVRVETRADREVVNDIKRSWKDIYTMRYSMRKLFKQNGCTFKVTETPSNKKGRGKR